MAPACSRGRCNQRGGGGVVRHPGDAGRLLPRPVHDSQALRHPLAVQDRPKDRLRVQVPLGISCF